MPSWRNGRRLGTPDPPLLRGRVGDAARIVLALPSVTMSVARTRCTGDGAWRDSRSGCSGPVSSALAA